MLILPSSVLLGIFTFTILDYRISEFYMCKTPWMLMPKFFLIQISFLMMALWLYEVGETAVPAEQNWVLSFQHMLEMVCSSSCVEIWLEWCVCMKAGTVAIYGFV